MYFFIIFLVAITIAFLLSAECCFCYWGCNWIAQGSWPPKGIQLSEGDTHECRIHHIYLLHWNEGSYRALRVEIVRKVWEGFPETEFLHNHLKEEWELTRQSGGKCHWGRWNGTCQDLVAEQARSFKDRLALRFDIKSTILREPL